MGPEPSKGDGRGVGLLAGRVVVVGVAEPDAARALAAEGATVVVVGSDPVVAGELVRSLVDAGHRAAAFVGDAATDSAALAEMVGELFPDRRANEPDPA